MQKDSTYRSDRLAYRGISLDDAETIVMWRSKPENYRFFFNSHAVTLAEHLVWFERYLEDPTRFDYMIIDSEGRRVGTVGLSDIDADSCEINYMIGDSAARGKGYAREAVRFMSKVAFDELGVVRVFARILPENEASIRVVEESGFSCSELVYEISSAKEREDDPRPC